jgi:hypothetical protein
MKNSTVCLWDKSKGIYNWACEHKTEILVYPVLTVAAIGVSVYGISKFVSYTRTPTSSTPFPPPLTERTKRGISWVDLHKPEDPRTRVHNESDTDEVIEILTEQELAKLSMDPIEILNDRGEKREDLDIGTTSKKSTKFLVDKYTKVAHSKPKTGDQLIVRAPQSKGDYVYDSDKARFFKITVKGPVVGSEPVISDENE